LLVPLQESRTETWNIKAFPGAVFISELAAAQRIHIQRLSPSNKEVSLYIPLQTGYRSKKQGLTCICLHVTLLTTSPPVLRDLFTSRFFKVLSPCYATLFPPATLSEHKFTTCSFFFFFCRGGGGGGGLLPDTVHV
jgi:hypothetical protein